MLCKERDFKYYIQGIDLLDKFEFFSLVYLLKYNLYFKLLRFFSFSLHFKKHV